MILKDKGIKKSKFYSNLKAIKPIISCEALLMGIQLMVKLYVMLKVMIIAIMTHKFTEKLFE